MKRILPVALLALLALPALSCTTFCLRKNGQVVFGRNYDWVTGAGIVHTNHRGLVKVSESTQDGSTIKWVSSYGSITFNQYGKEFPMGGMNEQGLVVELMWLDDTRYPAPDARPAVVELQWVQYQLDNCATVEEVIATDKLLRISNDATPLHYLVADAKGNTASIEFLKGKMVVHRGADMPFPVLANSTYEESARTAAQYIKSKSDLSNLDNSLERFVRACQMISQADASSTVGSLTDYAFDILHKVAQGDFTRWSIVYDISGKKIHFRTNEQTAIKTIDFTSFDLSCSATPKMLNMDQPVKGNITKRFTARDKNLSQELLDKAIRESRSRVNISDADRNKLLNYENTVHCHQ
jgi:penicillin V acylase-like amidase (Ntn superfamily)